MVLGLISLATTVPMVVTSVLSLQSQAENTDSHGVNAEWKTDKCHIRYRPSARTPGDRKEIFENSKVVLRNNKLYVQLSSYKGERLHPFSGYFLPYPDSNIEGLVSTISDQPPQLNWTYLDTDSKIFQICHGLRAKAEEGLVGPWGARVCSSGEIRFLMENWEGVIAVESEESGLWNLCFDRCDNGLKDKLGEGQRTVELELIRETTVQRIATFAKDLKFMPDRKSTTMNLTYKYKVMDWRGQRRCAAWGIAVEEWCRFVDLREGAELPQQMQLRGGNLEAANLIFIQLRRYLTWTNSQCA